MWGVENEFPTVGGARADYVSASDLPNIITAVFPSTTEGKSS